MPRAATIRSLADIAEVQWGLFTRQQAESTGMAWTTLARLAKHGIAERVTHGVYPCAAESNVDDRKRTTIRLTTAMREGAPRRPTRRQQPSRSS